MTPTKHDKPSKMNLIQQLEFIIKEQQEIINTQRKLINSFIPKLPEPASLVKEGCVRGMVKHLNDIHRPKKDKETA